MQTPLEFTIPVEDFIEFLLPEESWKPGTEAFRKAVTNFYAKQFASVGGRVVASVDDRNIHVQWIPDEVSKDPFGYALDLLQHGELKKAVPLLETFLTADPDDIDTLYNLGMAYSDLGNLDNAKRHLAHAVELEPDHINALVALGVAYQRSGDSEKAVEALEQAVKADPNNGYAHRNLGAILDSLGRKEEAEEHLRDAARLMPEDQPSIYGLAQCLEATGEEDKLSEADELYIRAIDLNPRSPIAELARSARSKLAQEGFRGATGGGVRMDAVMYCLSALQKFAKMNASQRQAVVFEIAMLGRSGLDTNDSTPKYKLRSLPGNYTGLQLVSMMYIGFKQIEPSMDAGFDLSKEYEAAQRLFSEKEI
jgi:tetratricopeptide (TPR) repeat protein